MVGMWESHKDTRWNKLLYAWSPELINSVQDTLSFPANLKTWSKHSKGLNMYYTCCVDITILFHDPHLELLSILIKSRKIQLEAWVGAAKIAHHIVPAIHRASAFTEDESEGYQKSVSTFDSGNYETPRCHHLFHCRKRCIVIKLTVPAEENLAQAPAGKKCKYADLIHECQKACWEVKYFPAELRSRGFTNRTHRSCFEYLDLFNKWIRRTIDDISRTAL